MSWVWPLRLRDCFETVMIISRKHPPRWVFSSHFLFDIEEVGQPSNRAHPWALRHDLSHSNPHMETFVHTKIIPWASRIPFFLFLFMLLPLFLFYDFFFVRCGFTVWTRLEWNLSLSFLSFFSAGIIVWVTTPSSFLCLLPSQLSVSMLFADILLFLTFLSFELIWVQTTSQILIWRLLIVCGDNVTCSLYTHPLKTQGSLWDS